jgi:hypothetical protein
MSGDAKKKSDVKLCRKIWLIFPSRCVATTSIRPTNHKFSYLFSPVHYIPTPQACHRGNKKTIELCFLQSSHFSS